MLLPKKVKYRKVQKGKVRGVDIRVNNPRLGFYGIKSTKCSRITSQQIEAIRKLISRKMHKSGSIKFTIFPFLPVTSKPAEVRMGKGKGSLNYWCFPVKSGRLLFEFRGVSDVVAFEINKLVNSKLGLKTKLVRFL